jgi:hypothetical protein
MYEIHNNNSTYQQILSLIHAKMIHDNETQKFKSNAQAYVSNCIMDGKSNIVKIVINLIVL